MPRKRPHDPPYRPSSREIFTALALLISFIATVVLVIVTVGQLIGGI